MWERIIAMFSRSDAKSSSVAKERLRVVLIQDRSNISYETLEKMKNELIKVIKKYVSIDEQQITVDFEADHGRAALVANIPILSDERRTA